MNTGSSLTVSQGATVYDGLQIPNAVTVSGAVNFAGSVSFSPSNPPNLYYSGTTNCVGGSTSTLPVTVSDRRLKKNIKTLDNPLNKIKGLTGVYFNWINDGSLVPTAAFNGRRQVGVFAQDVLHVLPEAISPIKNGEYLGVDYSALVPLLIEGVKELAKRSESITEAKKFLRAARSLKGVDVKDSGKIQNDGGSKSITKARLDSKDKEAASTLFASRLEKLEALAELWKKENEKRSLDYKFIREKVQNFEIDN
jgi:hypothetical protein